MIWLLSWRGRSLFIMHKQISIGRFIWIILWVFLYSCTKEVVIAQEVRVVDTVYVTDSKIYTDTIFVSDTMVKYVRKYDNPVLQKNIADPSVIRGENGIFYLYSTESQLFPHIPIYKSIDLVNWYFVGSAFNDSTRPTSFEGNLWAPDINCINGKYVLYYSMSVWGGEWTCGIGVAMADYPWGPFENVAKLFDSREIGVQNSIDPFYIEDHGEKYLFWGSHHGIYGIQLADDGLSVKEGAEKFQVAGIGGEGTYICMHNDQYFLFQSFGSCCSGLSSTYNIRVGRADTLRGPYYDRQGKSMMESTGTLFLQGNTFVAGPGHNSEIISDDDGVDWLLYHGYLRSDPDVRRVLYLDKINWDGGWPFIEGYGASQSSEIPFFK